MGHDESYTFPPPVSADEMRKNKIPLQYRDRCASLLIPLNSCRADTYYLPWKCEEERHAYEKCEYFEFKLRVKALQEQSLNSTEKSTL